MKSYFSLILSVTLLFNLGCLTKQSFQEFIAEESAVDSTLINYALPENGGKVIVSGDNPSHPASTLTNGITSSEKWDSGEGWETTFEGPFQRGVYYEYGRDAWLSGLFGRGGGGFGGARGNPNQQRPRPQLGVVETDPMWRGLRGNSFYAGGEVQTALAVAVVEFPEEKQIGRVVVYTVDSEKYPADEYGVSDLLLQYWAESGRSWFNVDRYGKAVGQKHDSILNNKSGRIVFRFKPVKTDKIRLAIRWTNDTEMYKAGLGSHYAKGTVRLTEIEVYGFEKKTSDPQNVNVAATGRSPLQMTPQQPQEKVNQLEVAESESESESVEAPEPDPLETTLEEIETEKVKKSVVDDRSSIKELIGVYEQAYKNRDLETFVSTISPNYARDGENFQQLRSRMEKLFAKYDRVDFTLNEVLVDQNGELATVAANYSAKLEEGKNPPLELSGRLFFKLSKEKDGWKIVRIDTQRK
jgi:ketosteroid isomerase-like protein